MSTLQRFTFTFTVRAPLTRVAAFHNDTRALKRLTPPPIFVQLHHVEPLAEGSAASFTLWFGPLPVRWLAVHSEVDALRGFTDQQRGGPLRWWKHTHRFSALDAQTTQVSEQVEYAHDRGWRGLLSRLLFNPPALRFLFAYRAHATRAALEQRHP
jgi:ligand-binding SRPBCC domain-containing protein